MSNIQTDKFNEYVVERIENNPRFKVVSIFEDIIEVWDKANYTVVYESVDTYRGYQ